MFRPIVKCRSVAGVTLSVLLCCAIIIGSVMVAPPTAKAGTSEQIDKLIQDWTRKYIGSDLWIVNKVSSPEEVQKLKKEGKSYRVLPQKSHIEQTKALRSALNMMLSQYDLTPTMLSSYYPSFSFWADKNDRPYWQIRFNVNSKEHKNLKPVTVQVNAIDGSIRYITHNDG